jgi:hypothetical protein
VRCKRLSARIGRGLTVAIALCLALACGAVRAQDAPPASTTGSSLAERLAAAEARNAELETAIGLLSQKLDRTNSTLAAKYQEVAAARYQHYIDLLAHRNAVFRWQLIASYVVLGIVALVTLAGLIFSAAQLYTALRLSQPQPNIDLELSASKVRITSSVVGVVVLTLSIVFLFLFLERIYDIQEIGAVAPPAAEAEAVGAE